MTDNGSARLSPVRLKSQDLIPRKADKGRHSLVKSRAGCRDIYDRGKRDRRSGGRYHLQGIEVISWMEPRLDTPRGTLGCTHLTVRLLELLHSNEILLDSV